METQIKVCVFIILASLQSSMIFCEDDCIITPLAAIKPPLMEAIRSKTDFFAHILPNEKDDDLRRGEITKLEKNMVMIPGEIYTNLTFDALVESMERDSDEAYARSDRRNDIQQIKAALDEPLTAADKEAKAASRHEHQVILFLDGQVLPDFKSGLPMKEVATRLAYATFHVARLPSDPIEDFAIDTYKLLYSIYDSMTPSMVFAWDLHFRHQKAHSDIRIIRLDDFVTEGPAAYQHFCLTEALQGWLLDKSPVPVKPFLEKLSADKQKLVLDPVVQMAVVNDIFENIIRRGKSGAVYEKLHLNDYAKMADLKKAKFHYNGASPVKWDKSCKTIWRSIMPLLDFDFTGITEQAIDGIQSIVYNIADSYKPTIPGMVSNAKSVLDPLFVQLKNTRPDLFVQLVERLYKQLVRIQAAPFCKSKLGRMLESTFVQRIKSALDYELTNLAFRTNEALLLNGGKQHYHQKLPLPAIFGLDKARKKGIKMTFKQTCSSKKPPCKTYCDLF